MQANVQSDTAGDDLADSFGDEMNDHLESRAGDSLLLYHRLPTFAEYLALVPQHRHSLEIRMGEIRIAPEDQYFFAAYPYWIRLLAIVEDGSPGTLAVLPLWAHIVALSPRLELRVLRQQEAASLLVALTEDPLARSILDGADLPLLLVLDEDWQVQAQWGPHPQAAQAYLARWQAAHPAGEQTDEGDPERSVQFAQEMRLWYNSGLDHACAAELRAVLADLLPDLDDAEDIE